MVCAKIQLKFLLSALFLRIHSATMPQDSCSRTAQKSVLLGAILGHACPKRLGVLDGLRGETTSARTSQTTRRHPHSAALRSMAWHGD